MVGLDRNCTQSHRLHSAGVFLLVALVHKDTITVLIGACHATRCLGKPLLNDKPGDMGQQLPWHDY